MSSRIYDRPMSSSVNPWAHRLTPSWLPWPMNSRVDPIWGHELTPTNTEGDRENKNIHLLTIHINLSINIHLLNIHNRPLEVLIPNICVFLLYMCSLYIYILEVLKLQASIVVFAKCIALMATWVAKAASFEACASPSCTATIACAFQQTLATCMWQRYCNPAYPYTWHTTPFPLHVSQANQICCGIRDRL